MSNEFLVVNRSCKEYVHVSSIVPAKSCSMGFLVPYGAVCLFLQRHGSSNNKQNVDSPSVDMIGVRHDDGSIEERTHVTLEDTPSPLSLPGRWAGHNVSVVCNGDNPALYERACRKFQDITVAFVEGWNFHFPEKGLEVKEPADTE